MSLKQQMRSHYRFWQNYSTAIKGASGGGMPDGVPVWRRLMADVQLIACSQDRCLLSPTGAMPASLVVFEGHRGSVNGALALADGEGFLSWSEDGTLRLWFRKGVQRCTWICPTGAIHHVLNPNVERLLILSGRHVHVLDWEKWIKSTAKS